MTRTNQEVAAMSSHKTGSLYMEGSSGKLEMPADDEMCRKMLMLFEGYCTPLGVAGAAEKFGYSRQRLHQLRVKFKTEGMSALMSRKRGPKGRSRRTAAVEREVIRHRFLDPKANAAVIAQKLRQTGHPVSIRSVERVIKEYGLQKKTPSVRSEDARAGGGVDAANAKQATQ